MRPVRTSPGGGVIATTGARVEYVIVMQPLPSLPRIYLVAPGSWTYDRDEAKRFEFLTVAEVYGLQAAGLAPSQFVVEGVYGR